MTRNGSSLAPPPPHRAVEALLAYERAIVEKPDAMRTRVLARAQESLWTGDMVALESLGVPVWARVLLTTAGSFAAVATVATVLHLTRHKETARPAESSTHVTIAETVPAARESSPMDVVAPAFEGPLRSQGKVAGPSHKYADAFEELRLLDRARRSDVRGDYASVLAIANSHARTYPDGRLVEEREVLRFKALVGLGRGRDARHLAGEFRRQFPRSVLLPTIEAMLASLR
jgi:hypothetical protein